MCFQKTCFCGKRSGCCLFLALSFLRDLCIACRISFAFSAHLSTHLCTPLHPCTPPYTSLHLSTHPSASLHLSTPFYTSTPLYIFPDISTYLNTSLHLHASLHLSIPVFTSLRISTFIYSSRLSAPVHIALHFSSSAALLSFRPR